MPELPAISRRSALLAVAVLGLGGGLLASTAACTPEERPPELTVAGGESGGFYLEFAALLADLLQRERVTEKAIALTTGGSLENIQRVLSGEATLAVALADAAAQATALGRDDGQLVALGKVYQNYVHCIVREDSGIRTFADLAGKTSRRGRSGLGHYPDGRPNHCCRRALGRDGKAGQGREPGQPWVEPSAGVTARRFD